MEAPAVTLAPVHRGYAYQDLFTASRLVDVLVGDASEVVVDRKLFAGDRFDDLTGVLRTLVGGPLRRREQVKWIDRAVPLELADLTTDRRSCRLDRLVAVATTDRAMATANAGVTEYRLVMTATPPTDPRVQRLLLPADETAPVHPGWQTHRYRIDANAVWPTEQGQPPPAEWSFLRSAVAREELTRFAAEFVLELAAPIMSGDLTDPGPAEQVLLARLAEDVGAGLYPNERRHPVDVAALLVATAAAARAGLSGVDRASLVARTGLREDFGAVARGKVVDLSREIAVQETRARLLDACARAQATRSTLAIVDAPGSGKSWAVDRLCRDLEGDGWLVLRHYCYLTPGDPDGEARVRTGAVIGSLLGQLADAVPDAVADMRPRYAADVNALAAALARVHERTGHGVAVVVDGLDHVTRVLGAAPGRRDPAAELVEMLSLLELPDNAVLVVATQPGEHLAALRDRGVVEIGLPPWGTAEVEALAARLGVAEAVRVEGTDEDGPDPVLADVVAALMDRSAGNPLYATYLCRELHRALRGSDAAGRGAPVDPAAFVRTLPPFDADLSGYYSYLLEGMDPAAREWLPLLLSVLDFAVTRQDLRELAPGFLATQVDGAVDRLAPVLVEVAGQGGLRIHHESLQRFLLSRFAAQGGRLGDVLQPVIAWLDARGLFRDARAFRFLLTLKVRAGEHRAVVDAVTMGFITDAITAGHPPAAIRANIGTAAEAAATLGDWPALIRLVELSKAVEAWAFERLDLLVDFADVPIALHGGAWLAERLLFDGATTIAAHDGVQLCAAVDQAGAVAPWQEYLAAYDAEHADDDTFDERGSDAAVTTALLLGQLRLAAQDGAAADRVFAGLARWLVEERPEEVIFTSVVRMVMHTYGITGAKVLIDSLPPSERGPYELALARHLVESAPPVPTGGELPDSQAMARSAVAHGLLPAARRQALLLGVHPALVAAGRERTLELTRAACRSDTALDETVVQEWVTAVYASAWCDPAALLAVDGLLTGPGWYRCWQRFVVALARRTASAATGGEVSVLPALGLLTEETNPFVGDPRACDLYRLQPLIAETLHLATEVVTDEEWPQALAVLRQVSNATTTSLMGSPGGPLDPEALLALIRDHTAPARQADTDAFLADYVGDHVDRGRFYSDIGSYHLARARVHLKHGDIAAAQASWTDAARYLPAYGWRKDITIFELLDPLEAITARDTLVGRACLVRVQPLVERVVEHTDGKETRHAPVRWWDLLADADPAGCGMLLARALLDYPSRVDWRLEEAARDLAHRTLHKAHPGAALALRLALPGDYADSQRRFDDDTVLLKRLEDAADPGQAGPVVDRDLVVRAADWLAADALADQPRPETGYPEDWYRRREDARQRLLAHTRALGSVASTHRPVTPEPHPAASLPPSTGARAPVIGGPDDLLAGLGQRPFDPGATADPLPDRLARLARRWAANFEKRQSVDAVTNAIGYRLLALCDAGRHAEAEALLRLLAQTVGVGDTEAAVLRGLAAGLERYGTTDLAATAHVLAYTRSRGRGGWLALGGVDHEHHLVAAYRLDPQTAIGLLADEVVDLVRNSRYGVYGVSQACIHAFATIGLPDPSGRHALLATALWQAACDVIAERLPWVDPADDPERPYDPAVSPTPTLEEALAATTVALAAHPARPVKRGALLGMSILLEMLPHTLAPAVRMLLAAERVSAALRSWVLQLLIRNEPPDYPVTTACAGDLAAVAVGPTLTDRALARTLLQRAGLPAPNPPATDIPELRLSVDDGGADDGGPMGVGLWTPTSGGQPRE
jgi:hypothetical protein